MTRSLSIEFLVSLLVIAQSAIRPSHETFDNEIIGTPIVRCDQDTITVSFGTRKPFNGRIFAKGESKNPKCSRRFFTTTKTEAKLKDAPPEAKEKSEERVGLGIEFQKCGMRQERKIHPTPGLLETVNLMIAFHPLFITDIDRSIRVNCFYPQLTEHNVTSGSLQVGTRVAQVLNAEQQRQMDICHYEIRKTSINGPPATRADVGEQLFHVWSCSGANGGQFLVKNCVAKDGDETVTIVDEKGCSLDTFVWPQINYNSIEESTKTQAWAQIKAFKFAESTDLHFTCTIQVCMDDVNKNCTLQTPPVCEPSGTPSILFENAEGENTLRRRARDVNQKSTSKRPDSRNRSSTRKRKIAARRSKSVIKRKTWAPNELDVSSGTIQIMDSQSLLGTPANSALKKFQPIGVKRRSDARPNSTNQIAGFQPLSSTVFHDQSLRDLDGGWDLRVPRDHHGNSGAEKIDTDTVCLAKPILAAIFAAVLLLLIGSFGICVASYRKVSIWKRQSLSIGQSPTHSYLAGPFTHNIGRRI